MKTNGFQKILGGGFCAGFAVLYAWIAWLTLREPQIVLLDFKMTVVFAAATGAICFFMYRCLQEQDHGKGLTIGRKNRDVLNLGVFFLIYIPIQIYIASQMFSVRGTSWDFNVVAGYAMDYAQAEDVSNYREMMRGTAFASYFSRWPNNIPLYLLLGKVFRLFASSGISLNVVGMGMNILAIDIAIIFLYFSVRKVTGTSSAACISLLLATLHIPLLVYVPIYYTDTLTLPFPIIGFYLWLKVKEELGNEKMGKALAIAIGMALLLGIGAVLKLTVIFILIAAVFDGLVSLPFKKGIVLVLTILVIGISAFVLLNQACLDSNMVVSDEEGCYIPKLHWVMMGLQGKGNYYDPDYQLTLSVPEEGRDKLVKDMIKIRLENYGLKGMVDHLYRKISFVWAEGTYYSALKIDRDRYGVTWMDTYVNWLGEKFKPYAEYCQGLLLLNYVSFVAAALSFLVSKPKRNRLLLVALIGIFGVFLFECIWEARSRYIFNYLPIFLVVTCSVWGNVLNKRKP